MGLPPTDGGGTCLVTGASSGIGSEIARELADRGRSVTMVARRAERLASLADELRSRHGVRVECLPADLTSETARGELPARLEELGLHVEILVNNAGLTTMGPVARADRAAELAMIRTDVEAVADLCTLFLPGMVDRSRGAVLNTASTAAFQPLPGQAGYGASKAFVLSYGWALRAELRGSGVNVTTLCPGPVETGFAEAAGLSDAEAAASLPKVLWVPAGEVARAAVAGLEQGRPVVIPGLANRLTATVADHVPRVAVTSLVARQHPALQSR